jgi:hypothetical protein
MPDCVQTVTRIDGSLHEAIRAAEFDCKSWGLACRVRDFSCLLFDAVFCGGASAPVSSRLNWN